MGILKDVLAELVGMFLADARLTLATLVLVAAVAALIHGLHVSPLIGGAVLLAGCVAIVLEATVRDTLRRSRR